MIGTDTDPIFNALMTGKILVEDMIAIDRAGIDTGFKRQSLQKMLREANEAIRLYAKNRGASS